MDRDELYMRRALGLAARGRGLTHPNPCVGALVVKGDRIVGAGYHRRCGLPHAEADALRRAGKAARGSTLYVTLEPCNHFGRTPPCTDLIIRSGVKRVVAAMKDPNPVTGGRGIRRLKARGIATVVGVLEAEAEALNLPFIKFMKTNMPYVTLKIAESLDGKIATRAGDSRWITSDSSRAYVHRLRRKADAVMVGANTAVTDDPTLLARVPGRKQPARVVVDSGLRTPLTARIFSTVFSSPVIIATTSKASSRKAAAYAMKGATVLFAASKGGRVGLKDLLRRLGRMGLIDILVEGGGELAASLVEARLVDRFLFFIAPKIIGGRGAVPSVGGRGVGRVGDALSLSDVKIRRFAKDILIEAKR